MTKRLACLYRITFPNGKVYVGFTHAFCRRMREHQNCASDQLVHRAIRHHGWENTCREILLTGDADFVLSLEDAFIQFFNAAEPHGYNVAEGGEILGPTTRSLATRQRQAETMRKKWEDPTYRRKVVVGVTGTTKSPEARAKMRALKLGRPLSPEHRRKLSESHRGFNWTEEAKRKLSVAKTGKPRGKRV